MAIKRYSTGESVPAHTWPIVGGETYVHADDYDALQSLNAELLEALESCLDSLWEDTREVRLDDTMMFGHGYDWDGWECYRWELHARQGSFAIWPAHGTYSAYGGLDGSYWNQCFANSAEAKMAIVEYVSRIDPDHPASKAYSAITKARSAQ